MIELTRNAARAVARFVAASDTPKGGLRIAVEEGGCAGLQYSLAVVAEPNDDDVSFEQNKVRVYLDAASLALVDGMTLDFIDTLTESGFRFSNPNAEGACSCGKSFSA